MKIALLMIGDGRDEVHERAFGSLLQRVDFGDATVIRVVVDDRDHRLGFAGAIQSGWDQVIESAHVFDWVFHFEADFTFNDEVRVGPMIRVLEEHPYLAQMSLMRQAWNPREVAAGGVIEADPDGFAQMVEGGSVWIEQRRYWTTNPCVYNANFCHAGWPQVPKSEGAWTHRLLADPKAQFGIWGAIGDPPLVEHIGMERAGVGY